MWDRTSRKQILRAHLQLNIQRKTLVKVIARLGWTQRALKIQRVPRLHALFEMQRFLWCKVLLALAPYNPKHIWCFIHIHTCTLICIYILSVFMREVKCTECELVDMAWFATFRAQTISKVLCHVLFFRYTLQMTRDYAFSVLLTLHMTWEFACFWYVRLLPRRLQVPSIISVYQYFH